MITFLTKCDILSNNNVIYFNKKSSHKSPISGVISIICYSLIFIFFIYFCSNVMNKNDPTSYFYKVFIPEIKAHFLNTSGIFHYIKLLDSNDDIKINEDSFIIFGNNEYIDKFLFNFSLVDFDHYYYGLCVKNDFIDNETLIKDNYIYKSFCIKGFWNSTLKKSILSSNKDFIFPYLKYGTSSKSNKNVGYGIYIIKCQKVSYRENVCKSKEIIEEEYNQLLRIKIIFKDNNFDISKYKKPILPYLLEVTNYLPGNTITMNNLNFLPVNIISDDGLLFKTKRLIESFRFDLNDQFVYNKTKENTVLVHFIL